MAGVCKRVCVRARRIGRAVLRKPLGKKRRMRATITRLADYPDVFGLSRCFARCSGKLPDAARLHNLLLKSPVSFYPETKIPVVTGIRATDTKLVDRARRIETCRKSRTFVETVLLKRAVKRHNAEKAASLRERSAFLDKRIKRLETEFSHILSAYLQRKQSAS